MNPTQFQSFFMQIAVMLAVAWCFGYLMKKLGQPIVLGEIIGGILLGPTLLGSVCPDVYVMLFPDDKAIITGMEALLKIGLLFFMFAAGLEVNLVHFRQSKKLIALTSLCGVCCHLP
jgi:Kef-type K+ transport system membrane component KefB